MLTDSGCIINQLFSVKYLKHGQACRRCEIISAESSSQHAAPWLYIRVYEQSSDRKTIAHSLCRSDEVGSYICVLVCKEFSCTPVSRLDLIEDEQRRMRAARLLKVLQK